MVENKEFWLTAHLYMNDEKEYFQGLEILEAKLEARLGDAGDQAVTLISEIINHIKKVIIFSTSFSKQANLLSQWRSYCPVEGGVSIGFDKEILESTICRDRGVNNIRYLQECCYDKEHSDWVADTICNGAIKHLQESGETPVQGKILKSTFFYEMLTFLARSKNEHFSEEAEVRLFTYCNEDFTIVDIPDNCNSPSVNIVASENVNFRAKKNFLVPFLKVNFPIEAIKEIHIGPSQYQKECESSLKMFLASKGLGGQCQIIKSQTPYRAI